MIQNIVWLWTDILLWGLCVGVLILAYMPKPQYIQEGWRKVGRSPLAMSAMVIILCYISIALLDSVHFRNQHEIRTLLDLALSPIDVSSEMTFSKPFADHSFISVASTGASGEVTWDKPALHYVNPHDYQRIPLLLIHGSLIGVAAWLFLNAGILLVIMRGNLTQFKSLYAKTETRTQWRSIFFTSLVVFVLIGMVLSLSSCFHVLGTDKVGQDVLYQSLKSIRTAVIIGTITTLVLLPLAIFLGTLAGYARGWVDDLIQYIYTTLSSIPGILLIAASVLMLDVWISGRPEIAASVTKRADLRLLSLCFILGVTSWTSLCRLLRAETLKLREQDYVMAAIAQGVTRAKIIRNHIMPNLMHIVLITVVLEFSALILTEAVLSYVGVGVDQSTYSWGTMINTARLELSREPVIWWSIFAAFLGMATLVLSANLFSDVVQKAFDPRARGK